MAGFFQFLPMLLAQQLGRQELERRPEPEQLTSSANQVTQYDRVMSTKLVLAYMAGLDVIRRVRDDESLADAVDLASGPGHFTLCLARYLDYSRVRGIDLSAPMVEIANRNAASHQGTADVRFLTGDMTRLDQIESASVDLCTLTEGAHHLPVIDDVRRTMCEMERVTRPQGTIVVMDLVRLRTAGLTEKYVSILGHDYVARGLPAFLGDFRHSMYASWTPSELYAAIPRTTARRWYHLVPRGLPTIQFVVGLPVNRERLFVRRGWTPETHPISREWTPRWQKEVSESWARETLHEFRLMQLTLKFGARRVVEPGRKA
jgi:ubiquinone/menaquinone biosynthesis C-methylase UbiE